MFQRRCSLPTFTSAEKALFDELQEVKQKLSNISQALSNFLGYSVNPDDEE